VIQRKLIALGTVLCSLATALALIALAGASPAFAEAPRPRWDIVMRTAPKYLQPGKPSAITIVAINLGDAPVEGSESNPVTITDELPKAAVEANELKATRAMHAAAQSGADGKAERPQTPSEGMTCKPRPTLRCEFIGELPAGDAIQAEVPIEAENVTLNSETEEVQLGENTVKVEGGFYTVKGEGGESTETAPSETATHPVAVSEREVPFGVERFELSPERPDGSGDLQAGSHPFELTTTVEFNQTYTHEPKSTPSKLEKEEGVTEVHWPGVPALVKNLDTILPPGLVGNTTVIPECSDLDFSTVPAGNYNECPADTAIGFASVTIRDPGLGFGYVTEGFPVFNLVPGPGEPARIGLEVARVPVILSTGVQTGKGYAVEVDSKDTSELAEVLSAVITVWGVPGAASHQEERGWQCLASGWRYYALPLKPKCEPAGPQPAQPYLTLPTTCKTHMTTSLLAQSWQPGAELEEAESTFVDRESVKSAKPLEGCEALPFSEPQFRPSIEVTSEQHTASTPTGLKVVVRVPQTSTLEPTLEETGKAEADIKATTVTLPPGVLANAGLANGLTACVPGALLGQSGFEEVGSLQKALELQSFSLTPDLEESCLEGIVSGKGVYGSKLGTVKIVSPLLEEPLVGSVFLGSQDTNPFKSPLVLYLIAEGKKSGVLAKFAGTVNINQETGQLTTTFEGTPPVPFETLELELPNEEGGRAANTTPPQCGPATTTAEFFPFSEEGEQAPTVKPLSTDSSFEITQGAGGTPCPSSPLSFAPAFQAGSTNTQAAALTPFTVTIGRPDGQQALERINMELPPGLAALISQVTLCTEAQAEADECPAESQVGHTTSVSGLGGKPVTLGGKLYLTGPLVANSKHGAGPFGLLAETKAQVGPFNLGDVNVFSTINVNETTAQAIVTSGQIPQFVKGAPVQLKELNVVVERPGGKPFQFNPTNCEELKISGKLTGYEGKEAPASEPFYASNCASLPFAPKLTASVVGQGSKADGTTFVVTLESPGLGQANIHKVDLTIPAKLPSRLTTIQKACPEADFDANPASCDEGSVIGEGIVHTPVFANPLRGPAYLVSHGGAEFPDVEFVLQGEGVKLVLDGKTHITGGVTYSKFETAPDAPFTKFESIFPAGPHSALTPAVAESENFNLCKTSLALPTEITGQNGAFIGETVPVDITGCGGVLPSKVVKPTKAQLLAKALKACKTKYKAKSKKSKRVACEKAAHKKYGSKAKKSAKKAAKKSSKK
jgi:hypothetical protein